MVLKWSFQPSNATSNRHPRQLGPQRFWFDSHMRLGDLFLWLILVKLKINPWNFMMIMKIYRLPGSLPKKWIDHLPTVNQGCQTTPNWWWCWWWWFTSQKTIKIIQVLNTKSWDDSGHYIGVILWHQPSNKVFFTSKSLTKLPYILLSFDSPIVGLWVICSIYVFPKKNTVAGFFHDHPPVIPLFSTLRSKPWKM